MITLGAMSGTSTDGIDVAALELIEGRFHYLGMVSQMFPPELRSSLLRFQQVPLAITPASAEGPSDVLTELLQVRKALSQAYVFACETLLLQLRMDPSAVACVGVHGQTLRHRPDLGFTYQTIDPALIASRLSIHVVSDFRAKDVALGGQGAPLVPGFHEAWIRGSAREGNQAVLNLGGFSNLTLLTASGNPYRVIGGDCGPANVWMDHVMRQNFNRDFDPSGEVARRGQVDPMLLKVLRSHPFFAKSWPKSTGRDDFSVEVLEQAIESTVRTQGCQISPEDLMRTLLELCAHTVVDCLRPHSIEFLWVCGGGALNVFLLERIQTLLDESSSELAHQVRVKTTEDLGLPVMAVEAAAFAWLAAQFMSRSPSNCVGVTGASRPAILGSITYFD